MPRLRYFILVSEPETYMAFNGNSGVYSPILDDVGVKAALATTDKLLKGAPARQDTVIGLALKLANESSVKILCSTTKISTVFQALKGKTLDVTNGAFDVEQVRVPKKVSYR